MAALPTPARLQVLDAIDAWRERTADQAPRPHLGASQIGQPCERRLWYGFRWAARETFNARMLRLFDRGQREEAAFVEELRGAGVTVHAVDPGTGQQFRFSAVAGHFGGSMDGVALGIPDAPKTWHLLEFKTHSAKSFADLQKKGVAASKPLHAAQMQTYMHMADLDRALYLAVNKDDDTLHGERLRRDREAGARLIEKAERVIRAPEPLPGISTDPAWYECKFCPAAAVCHGTAIAPVSCRTCLHATPELDGNGRWSCAKWGSDIPAEAQAKGCDQHRYIPALLAKLGEAVDADAEAGWVEYRTKDGATFRNGDPETTPGALRSSELALGAAALTFAADPVVAALRAQGGVVTSAEVQSLLPEAQRYVWRKFANGTRHAWDTVERRAVPSEIYGPIIDAAGAPECTEAA